MWYEIFKFEIKYRAKRPDTYIYFAILFLFSLIAVNFVFEDSLRGPVKANTPYVIAYTMTVLSAIFMMVTSMIMSVAVLRDFEHSMEALMFVNPIKKRDYLFGRFLGSFVVLLFIFSGLLWALFWANLCLGGMRAICFHLTFGHTFNRFFIWYYLPCFLAEPFFS